MAVIKTYVAAGLGIGIIAPMGFDPENDVNLRTANCHNLFTPATTSFAIRRGRLRGGFVYRFAQHCASCLTEAVIRDVELIALAEMDAD